MTTPGPLSIDRSPAARDGLVVAIMAAIILSPMYVFRSGMPQPADVVWVAACLLALGAGLRWRIPRWSAAHWLLMLTTWVVVVNFVWYVLLDDFKFITSSSYFVFNLMVSFVVVASISNDDRFASYIKQGVSIAMFVCLVSLFFHTSGRPRAVGFFNNPNQLAYFCLVGVGLLMVSCKFKIFTDKYVVIGIVCGAASIFAASSLAGMGGLFIMLFAAATANLKVGIHKIVIAIVVAVILVAAVDLILGGLISNNVGRRLARIPGKLDSVFSDRKYDRILNYPGYVIFGAGEGGFARRFAPYVPTEIHSSVGTLLFSYGIPGILIFFGLIFSAVRRAPVAVWMVVGALMFYSLTHMGLRSTIFWVFIAYTWAIYRHDSAEPNVPLR